MVSIKDAPDFPSETYLVQNPTPSGLVRVIFPFGEPFLKSRNTPKLRFPEAGVTEAICQREFGYIVRYKSSLVYASRLLCNYLLTYLFPNPKEDRLWMADPAALKHIIQVSGYNYLKPAGTSLRDAIWGDWGGTRSICMGCLLIWFLSFRWRSQTLQEIDDPSYWSATNQGEIIPNSWVWYYGTLPFSTGVKGCIGRRFACVSNISRYTSTLTLFSSAQEIQAILILLMSNFKFSLPKNAKGFIDYAQILLMVEGERDKGAQLPFNVTVLYRQWYSSGDQIESCVWRHFTSRVG